MADHKKAKKKKKKRGRSRIFASCFRSFQADERPLLRDNNSDDRIVTDGRLGKPVLVAVSGRKGEEFALDGPDVDLVTDGGNGTGTGVERTSGRRGFSRLLKAVLFESVMVKKNRSSSRSSIASDTTDSFSSIEKIAKPLEDNNTYGIESSQSTDISDSSSRRSNLLSSSSQTTTTSYSISTSSSTNSNSQWLSDQKTSPPIDLSLSKPPIPKKLNPINSTSRSHFDQNPNQLPKPKPKRTNSMPQSSSHHKQLSQSDSLNSRTSSRTSARTSARTSSRTFFSSASNNWNIRLCFFLLLSLIVLVVYGRIYSILCTSTWLYLVPCSRVRRVKRVNSVTNAARLDTDSDQYKKRVIMAGLLDRTRNPLR